MEEARRRIAQENLAESLGIEDAGDPVALWRVSAERLKLLHSLSIDAYDQAQQPCFTFK